MSQKKTGGNGAVGVSIGAPNMRVAEFKIIGDAVLVIHRFSQKVKLEMLRKMEAGKASACKKVREPKDADRLYEEARYVSKDGWEGFHAASLRCAMIDCCRLVSFKMTLAKMSVFTLSDGLDAIEPQIPLVRIYGKSIRQDDMARVETGQPYVTVRAAYHNWYAKPRIRWDADQFALADVTNLLARVGAQCGIGEGRPNSKNSCGMGWGLFHIAGDGE